MADARSGQPLGAWWAALARNKRKSAVLAAYALATAGLVIGRWQQYADAPSPFVPLARASAAGIYLNCALVLLPMMRLALSRRWLGALWLLLPVHKAVEAHMIAGVAILSFSAIHVAAYAGLWLSGGELFWSLARPLPLWTGLVLALLYAALGWGAWRRTRGRFEAFYYTHFLSIPIGALSMLHAPRFLPVVGLPLLLFLLDRAIRLLWMTHSARIASIAVDGRDLHLVLDRPPGFSYRAGDYAFLCVPALSSLQWHPFSLINAPSDTAGLAFRIRRVGSWTAALSALAPGTPVYVDGPFASPCRDLHGCPRAIVVAGGIGITPFVSFLAESRVSAAPPFERLHLIWLERDTDSFRAFSALLDELEGSLGGALTFALVAGTVGERPPPRRATTGPVDWDRELLRLRDQEGLTGATLFFCGSPALSEALRASSRRVGFKFRTESF